MARMACPDWLDGAARNEWHRLVGDEGIGPENHETLAVYSFVVSLRQRVRMVAEIVRSTAGVDSRTDRRQDLLTVLTELEERLASDVRDLSVTLGIEDEGPGQRRPTRILILDEGVG